MPAKFPSPMHGRRRIDAFARIWGGRHVYIYLARDGEIEASVYNLHGDPPAYYRGGEALEWAHRADVSDEMLAALEPQDGFGCDPKHRFSRQISGI